MGSIAGTVGVETHFIGQGQLGVWKAAQGLRVSSERLAPELRFILSTFLNAIDRIGRVSSVFFHLAWLSAVDRARSEIAARCKLDAADQFGPLADQQPEELARRVSERTHSEMMALLSSEPGQREMSDGAWGFLTRGTTALPSQAWDINYDVMAQCTVGVWTAMEVFTEDFVRALVNLEPQLVSRLIADPSVGKKLGAKKWSLDELVDAGVDLSGKVGDLLASIKELTTVGAMQAVLRLVLGNPSGLGKALNDRMLIRLEKTRHLLVHRDGIVDDKFRSEIGGQWAVGQKLIVSADELREFARVVMVAVEEAIGACLASKVGQFDQSAYVIEARLRFRHVGIAVWEPGAEMDALLSAIRRAPGVESTRGVEPHPKGGHIASVTIQKSRYEDFMAHMDVEGWALGWQ